MAELALLASIVQIADTGYRLSLKLYTSGEAISSADRTIITISKDISLTSTVLKELGEILRRDQEEKEKICSENFIQTAGNTVKECLDAFEELDSIIFKNMPNLSQGHRATRATMALERLKWPFIQPRIQLLRGSLDMLRANISLMLNVLTYARHVSERKKLRTPAPDVCDEIDQRTLIKNLANVKEEYVRRFESLKLSDAAGHSTQQMHTKGSRAAPGHTEGNGGPTQGHNPLPRATFGNAPAPQRQFSNTSASYPIVPMDSVTIPPDQYSSWPLLRYFDTLMANLIREVYSPEYHIPAKSRSRFTGAIRETHTLEVVEAKTREPTRSAASGCALRVIQAEPQLPSGIETNTSRVTKARRREPRRREPTTGHFLSSAAIDREEQTMSDLPLSETMHRRQSTTSAMVDNSGSYARPMRRSHSRRFDPEERRRYDHAMDFEYGRGSPDDDEGYGKAEDVGEAAYSRAKREQAQMDQGMVPKEPGFDLVLRQELSSTVRKPVKRKPREPRVFRGPMSPEPERNDVVDDLVKLWTLVR